MPLWLVQMRYSIEENGCGHILMGGTSGGKERKKEKTGKGGGYVKGKLPYRWKHE